MSQWTHVSGTIRIDGIPNCNSFHSSEEESNKQRELDMAEIKEILGKPIDYHDIVEAGYEDIHTKVPMGSEGSLRYSILPAEKEYTGMVLFTIVIWGDLRDYSSMKNITDWVLTSVDKITEKLNFYVRDGVLKIDTEYHEAVYLIDFIYRDGTIHKIKEVYTALINQ